MPKKIVFLNLADMHEHGLAMTTVRALRVKYPRASWLYEFAYGRNEITLVDLFDLLDWQRRPRNATPLVHLGLGGLLLDPRLFHYVSERVRIIELCAAADKVMLGVHGNFGDTSRGHKGLGWDMGMGIAGTYDEFANLVGGLLKPDRAYRLALIMCYGARSLNYLKDHDRDLTVGDVQSSFAYKFYALICKKARVTMTARTGSVGFDAQTGRSLVQTEAAVTAQVEDAEMQAVGATRRAKEDYDTVKERMFKLDGDLTRFFAIEERMSVATAVATNDEERAVKAFYDTQRTATRLQNKARETDPKQGKFVYTFDGANISVFRKYEEGRTVMRPLYHGPP
jgi:hypothetical protein